MGIILLCVQIQALPGAHQHSAEGFLPRGAVMLRLRSCFGKPDTDVVRTSQRQWQKCL